MEISRKRIVVLTILAAAALVATALYAGWFRNGNALEGSGTVEARNIRVGSKVGGRIEQVLVREGDAVEAGQVLVTFDDRELKAALEQSLANWQKMNHGYRTEDIAEARAVAAQAKADYEQRKNGYRQEDISAARAELERAKADEARTELDFHRYDNLSKKEIVSRQQRDTAEAMWKMAIAQRQSGEQKFAQLERGYRPEEIASAVARFHQTQAALEKMLHGNRVEDVELTRAQVAYDEARYRERQVVAPSPATVEVLDVRPGDLIAPNTPVATLLERDQIYVRVYIPETEIGRVKIGQACEVRVDSFPKTVFDGVVEQINQQAEFIPRNVQTKEGRVHQVFGIKLRISDPSGRVRAGMAADVKLKLGN